MKHRNKLSVLVCALVSLFVGLPRLLIAFTDALISPSLTNNDKIKGATYANTIVTFPVHIELILSMPCHQSAELLKRLGIRSKLMCLVHDFIKTNYYYDERKN